MYVCMYACIHVGGAAGGVNFDPFLIETTRLIVLAAVTTKIAVITVPLHVMEYQSIHYRY